MKYFKIVSKILIIVIIAYLVMSVIVSGSENYKILVLSSYDPSFPSSSDMMEGVYSVFPENRTQVDFEFMDTKALPAEENKKLFAEYLEYKLSQKPSYDLILAFDENAVYFAEEYQRDLFDGIPIVFAGLNSKSYGKQVSQNPMITGVLEDISIKETIDIIYILQPGVEKIYLLVDNTLSGQTDLERVTSYDIAYEIINFSELDEKDYLNRLSKIENYNAVIPISIHLGKKGFYDFHESLKMVLEHVDAPTYHFWKHGMGEGLVGGKLNSHVEQASLASSMGLSILQGKDPSEISLVEVSPNKYIFDYEVLLKHGLNPALLPEDAELINKPESFRESNPVLYWQIMLLIISLALIIAILVVIIYYRTLVTKRALRANEFLEKVINAVKNPIAIKNKKLEYVMCNKSFLEMISQESSEILGKEASMIFDGEALELINKLDEDVSRKGEVEGEITTSLAGQNHIINIKKNCFEDGRGETFFISSGNDITDIRKYENDLEALVYERTKALADANLELERLTMTDGLTGLYNRRKLDDFLKCELNRFQRYGNKFSVIIADIDKFKSVLK